MKRILACIAACTMLMTCLSLSSPVYGSEYPYDTLEERTAINQQMYDIAATQHTSDTVLARYQDKSLKDMYETAYKGLTSVQRAEVKELSDRIIAERAAETNAGTLTDYEKLRAFHDWIIKHFYYYRNVDALLGEECDNPYYLITTEYNNSENDGYGKIRSRCNGYTSTLIAFARAQDIPARAVDGTYNTEARIADTGDFFANKSEIISTHHWAQAYADRDGDGIREWIIIDCNADCWNQYQETAKDKYVERGNYDGDMYQQVREAYFDPTAERLAQSHILMDFRAGSKDVEYLTNDAEIKKLKTFLNIKSSGKTNGKRLNSSYKSSNMSTWFHKDKVKYPVEGTGNGNLYKLYMPPSKYLAGKLDLNDFKSLQNVKCEKNKLTSFYAKNCPKLSTVSISYNKMKYIDTRGSNNIKLLSTHGNPAVYVKYGFNKNRTAIVKTNYSSRGTVSVKYSKPSTGKNTHQLKAVSKKGYKFKGWYSGSRKMSSKATYTTTKSSSFTYTAKFVRR